MKIIYRSILVLIFVVLKFLIESRASKSTHLGSTIHPNMSSYSSLIKKLYKLNINFPVKLDLSNSNALYKILGFPLKNIAVVHVAGTNGKGSVTLKVAKSLQYSGLKVGLFVSPHISSFRERIQFNGESIGEEDLMVSLNIRT